MKNFPSFQIPTTQHWRAHTRQRIYTRYNGDRKLKIRVRILEKKNYFRKIFYFLLKTDSEIFESAATTARTTQQLKRRSEIAEAHARNVDELRTRVGYADNEKTTDETARKFFSTTRKIFRTKFY